MSSILSGLALIISIGALGLGWTAYSRTNVDVGSMISSKTEAAANEVRNELVRFQADVNARFEALTPKTAADESASSTEESEADTAE
jgi:hypothetical protein